MASGYKRDSRGRFSGGYGAGALGGKGAYAGRASSPPRGSSGTRSVAASGARGGRVKALARKGAGVAARGAGAGVLGLSAGVAINRGRPVDALILAAGASSLASSAAARAKAPSGSRRK